MSKPAGAIAAIGVGVVFLLFRSCDEVIQAGKSIFHSDPQRHIADPYSRTYRVSPPIDNNRGASPQNPKSEPSFSIGTAQPGIESRVTPKPEEQIAETKNPLTYRESVEDYWAQLRHEHWKKNNPEAAASIDNMLQKSTDEMHLRHAIDNGINEWSGERFVEHLRSIFSNCVGSLCVHSDKSINVSYDCGGLGASSSIGSNINISVHVAGVGFSILAIQEGNEQDCQLTRDICFEFGAKQRVNAERSITFTCADGPVEISANTFASLNFHYNDSAVELVINDIHADG